MQHNDYSNEIGWSVTDTLRGVIKLESDMEVQRALGSLTSESATARQWIVQQLLAGDRSVCQAGIAALGVLLTTVSFF